MIIIFPLLHDPILCKENYIWITKLFQNVVNNLNIVVSIKHYFTRKDLSWVKPKKSKELTLEIKCDASSNSCSLKPVPPSIITLHWLALEATLLINSPSLRPFKTCCPSLSSETLKRYLQRGKGVLVLFQSFFFLKNNE